ncbi:MAG: hypothetical protein IJ666_03365 [Ruminococcus sp.]|nr:hypothetical protein [Ruminococcus sp.]
MEELLMAFDKYHNVFPQWFIIAYFVFLAVGIIVALKNKKNLNRILWLTLVSVFPFYGTVITIVCCAVMSNITKKKPLHIFDYHFRKSFIIVPMLFAIIGYFFADSAVELLKLSSVRKYNISAVSDSIPAFFAMLTLFFMFLSTYAEYRRSNVYMHINKSVPDIDKEYVHAKPIYGYHCLKEEKAIIPDPVDVKNIASLYYMGRGLRSGDNPWKYNATSRGKEFNFNIVTSKEFEGIFDVENAEYLGRGITRLSVLQWDDRTVQLNDMSIPVKRYTLWHTIPSFAPTAAETLTSLLIIFTMYTPFGTGWFLKVFDSFAKFFT